MIETKQKDSDELKNCKSKLAKACKLNNTLQEKNELLIWERNTKADQLDDYINNIRNLEKTLLKTEPVIDYELQKKVDMMKDENLRLHNLDLARRKNPNLIIPKSRIIEGGKILCGIVFNTTTLFLIIILLLLFFVYMSTKKNSNNIIIRK